MISDSNRTKDLGSEPLVTKLKTKAFSYARALETGFGVLPRINVIVKPEVHSYHRNVCH